jgi:hypothetical protein
MNPSFKLRYAGVFRLFSIGLIISVVLVTSGINRASAQATSTTTVTGQVTDQQGAAIAGVEVKLIDPTTNTVLTTSTNSGGRYVFVNASSGTYSVIFSKAGFATTRLDQQQVQIGTTLTLNASLQVGSTSTTVEVQAHAAAELQTTNASVGTTLSNSAILALPNLGRDVAALAVLQPGVGMGGSTAGAVQDQNTYTIDGGNNSDDMAGNNTSYVTNFTGMGGAQTNGSSAGVVPTPVESIEEFKVTTFNQTADFNNGLGSQVQMVTKRGTNQFHGAAYGYYFATNVAAANFWDKNHTPSGNLGYTPLPSNHRNRFGGAVGGPIAPNFLGGKWYFFFNYEGSRFPNSTTYERPVPSDLLKLGVVQLSGAAYNLNPYPVTYKGVTYQPALCGTTTCDPRGIGINPVISQIWNKQMPTGNDPLYGVNGGDGTNVLGFLSTLRTPLNSDTYVGRIDHDFSDKWHFFASYRFMRLVNLTNNQVDIGGVLPGDTLGQPAATAPRNQIPWMYVGGLTTTLSPSATNDFRYSYTRNFWQWGSANAPPQLAGLGGAVEIAPGTAQTTSEFNYALIPYNINTQNIRQRFWDGKDHMFKDDLTMIKGSHILQFGGLYQRNFDFHMRTDNGVGVNNQIVYQVGSSGTNFGGFTYPNGLPASAQTNFQRLYSEALGLLSQSQVAYTRSGNGLSLQPVGSVAYERSVIPTYNLYISDTWHMKPAFTLTYGLSWALEMPPYELDGNQVILVDPSGKAVDTASYIAQRKAAALAGQVYNPTLGYETIKGTGRKYPYDPVWNEFSPRVALAWNPKYSDGLLGKFFGDGKTVLRGGYGRIYGRLNGVDLVLVPLLGPGLLQSVSCQGGVMPSAAVNGNQCLGSGVPTPANAFRIGTDGTTAPLPAASQTLPQPFFPGLNGAYAQDPSSLDPKFRPERTDNFTFSIQRAIGSKMTFEAGYIGRIIRNEAQNVNIDAVPYMTTQGGQTFAQAYAATYFALAANNFAASTAVPAQPFFETALGGANSSYCKGSPNCTAKLVSQATPSFFQNTQVSNIWKTLNSASSWTLGNTMLDTNQMSSTTLIGSLGYGNYNALFLTYRVRDYHGITAISNFTWGRSLGTAAQTQASSSYTTLDPYNMAANYGPNSFDTKFIYNMAVTYQPPFFRNQRGIAGRILGGWTISPLFTAQSGAPLAVIYSQGSLCSQCQAFGESSSSAITSFADNAVGAYPYTGGGSISYSVPGSNGIGTANSTGVNMFNNPELVYNEFRRCILGYDTSCGGNGNIRAMPTWNLDATVLKDIGVWKEGRVGATLSFQISNVLNHAQLGSASPSATTPNPVLGPSTSNLTLTTPSQFGRITVQANTPRNMEFGLRIHF